MRSEKRNDVAQTLNYVTFPFLRNSLAKPWSPRGTGRSQPPCVPLSLTRLALPFPKPSNPLCLCPGSMAEGEPKIALQKLGWPLFSAAPAKEQLKAGRKADLVGNGGSAGSFSTKGWQPRNAGNRLLAPCRGCWLMDDPEVLGGHSTTGTQALLKAQTCISSLFWKWGRLSRKVEMLIPTLWSTPPVLFCWIQTIPVGSCVS